MIPKLLPASNRKRSGEFDRPERSYMLSFARLKDELQHL